MTTLNARALAMVSVLALSGVARLPAQEAPRVVVVDASGKDLKRTAQRLRIPVSQLKSARAALSAATDLAGGIDFRRPPGIEGLGKHWVDLDRQAAPSRLDGLVRALRARAAEAEDPVEFGTVTRAAEGLVRALATVDAGRAAAFIRDWPAPPGARGRSGLSGGSLKDGRAAVLGTLVEREPERALALMEELGGPGQASWGLRGLLAASLHARGRSQEALRLVEGVTAEFDARPPDAAGLREYVGFIVSLTALGPDRVLAAFRSLRRLGGATPGQGTTLAVGDRTLVLTPAEAAQWRVVESLVQQPEICVKTLEAAPELEAKVDAVGGLDRLVAVSYGVRAPGIRSGRPRSKEIGGGEPMAVLLAGLRGKALKNPAYVREVLAAEAGDVVELTVFAYRLSGREPELASLLIERAVALLPGVEPLETRGEQAQALLAATREVDGVIDRALFRQGFIVVDALREAAPESPGDGSRPDGAALRSRADTLEEGLVAEYARVDFTAALDFARSLPGNRRLAALLAMVQALRAPL